MNLLYLCFSAAAERTLSLFHIDRDSVDKVLDLQHEDEVLSACVSSDGRLLASGAADQLIRVRGHTLSYRISELSQQQNQV